MTDLQSKTTVSKNDVSSTGNKDAVRRNRQDTDCFPHLISWWFSAAGSHPAKISKVTWFLTFVKYLY